MKRKLTLRFLIAALAGISSSVAQEERKADSPPPPEPVRSEQRPPLPPQELRDRPPRDFDRPPGDRPRTERRLFDTRRPDGPPGPPDRDEGRGEGGFREQRRESMERPKKLTPYLGVVSVPAPPVLIAQLGLEEGFGLMVENILPDSPAQAAGIQRYDVLKLLNDQQLVSAEQLARLVNRLGKDGEANLTIIRKGQEQKVTVKVGEKMLPARSEEERIGFRALGSIGSGRAFTRERGEDVRIIRDRTRIEPGTKDDNQDAMRRYQEQLREWEKNPTTEPPRRPGFPRDREGMERSGRPGQFRVRPADILRDFRPGDRPGMQAEWSQGSSRWDATQARVVMRDADGELAMEMKDGKRILTIKNAGGDVVFTGPADSPEEQAAIPEQFRGKLAMMAPPPPPGDADQPPRPPRPPGPAAPPERADDVQ